MFGWLCNFIGHKDIHIAGNVWQCWRCKTCSMGQDLHAKHGIGMQYSAPMQPQGSLRDIVLGPGDDGYPWDRKQ